MYIYIFTYIYTYIYINVCILEPGPASREKAREEGVAQVERLEAHGGVHVHL